MRVTSRATVASGRTRWLPQPLAFTLRCSVLVCLRCGASRVETLPRGCAIDAERGDQLGGGIGRLELEDG